VRIHVLSQSKRHAIEKRRNSGAKDPHRYADTPETEDEARQPIAGGLRRAAILCRLNLFERLNF
jgi:hypothetical protein